MPRPVPHLPGALAALAALLVFVPPAGPAERPQAAAVRATGPIRVDGVLDEPDWARATPISGFRLIEDREGEAPSESTEVRVLFDGTSLTFGCRCWNRGPGAIRASLAPRDQVLELDNIRVHLDPYLDRHRAFTFGVNPYGVQVDGIFTGGELDTQWDGVWDAEATRDSAGWTAELAIPLRTLRFPGNGPGTWGLWIRRQIQKNDEVCSWPLYRLGEGGDVMLQAADLTGLAGLRGGGLVDLQPYAASTLSSQRAFDDAGVAGPWAERRQGDMGLDARVALSSTMVLNATLHPDFSQIEADALQIDVNQRYPLQYEEKRPFFLEGGDIFGTAFDLIYTRRIADPAYGTKLTGRLGHVRLGGLVVRDDGGGSLAGVGGGPSEGTSTRGWFHLGRAAWEIGENSSVGALVALHQSDRAGQIAVPAVIGETLVPDGGANAVFAADADVRLSRRWFFHGQVAGSRTNADTLRFSNRSDGGGGLVGRERRRDTSEDVAYGGEFDYSDGIRELQLFHQYLGPDFRAESGFLSRVDLRRTRVNSSFMVRPHSAVVRSIQPMLEGYVMHDRSGRLQEWWVSPMMEWRFQKQTLVHTMVERIQERWQSRDYLKTVWSLFAQNSTWKALALDVEVLLGDGLYYGDSDATSFRGWSEAYEVEAGVRPSPRLTAELAVNRSRFSRDHGRDLLYDVWTLGAKTTWQFTRRLYTRVYPQYETETRHLDADALVGYVIHPGSVIYLGYNGDADRIAGRNRATGHTAFFKVSYLLQR